LPLLASGTEQAPQGVTEVTFEIVVGTRQSFDIVAMEQAGPIAGADLIQVMAKGFQAWREIRQGQQIIQVGAQLTSHILASGGGYVSRFQDVVNVSQPSLALPQFAALRREGSQSSLEATAQASQTRVMAMGEQIMAQGNDSLEMLVSLAASEAQWRSPFEGQQVAGMAEQLCDDGISHSPI